VILRLPLAALLVLATACTAASPAPTPTVAPATSAAGSEVTVSAAASLTDAFKEIGGQYQQRYPGSKVTFNFGASSQLRAQLTQGAKVDVFASADAAQMSQARQAGVIAGDPRVFATNRLTIIVPKDNPAHVTALKDLGQPGLKFVTAQAEVPVGQYTEQILTKASQDAAYGASFKSSVEANVVSREDDVRQVVAKIALGEGDAAIVYTTDVTPSAKPKVAAIAIPDQLNVVATYPIAVVTTGSNPRGGAQFVDFVVSPEGQQMLEKWGFGHAGP
jgi:molybdate transport system substrate-binding protein